MPRCARIGEGVDTAPPPRERRKTAVRSIEFDHESAKAELIGSASSEDPDRPRWTELKVWFLHNPPQRGRPWLSEVYGMSRVAGETPRIQRLNVGSLERALKLFADSDIGVVASEEARDWEEQRGFSYAKSPPDVVTANPEFLDKMRQNPTVRELHALQTDAGETTERRFRCDERAMAAAIALIMEEGLGHHCAIEHVAAHFRQFAGTNVDPYEHFETDQAALEWLYGETDGGKATFASMLAKDFDLAPRTVTTALSSGTPIRIPLRLALRFFDRDAFRDFRDDERFARSKYVTKREKSDD